jgi:hypothetical protein
MYGHHLGQAAQPYFGPPAPGQSWQTYETSMAAPLAVGAGVIAASMVHPLLGLAVGLGAMVYGGSTMHQRKPGQQGG